MSEPPSSWTTVSLGSVANYVTSGSRDWSRFYSTSGALFVRTQDINTNRLTAIENIARVQLPAKIEGKRTLIQLGDILITITGANVGKCAYISNPVPEAYVSQSVALVRLLDSTMGPFIHLQLISPGEESDKTLLQQSAYGMGRPVLSLPNVRDVPLKMAPVREQQRIVQKLTAVLNKVDACRERLDRVPQILKEFRQAVLEAAVSGRLTEEWRENPLNRGSGSEVVSAIADVRRRERLKSGERTIDDEGIEIPDGPIPDSWVWCRVGHIADVRLGGTPPRAVEAYWDGDVPWVSSGEVCGRIRGTRETISKEGVANSNAKVYPPGTVLIAMIGEGKTRGQAAILDIAASTNQNVAGLVFDGGSINSEYVWRWALAQYERTRNIGRGGNQPALNGAKVRALPIPVPPRLEQEEIVRRVRELLALADSIQHRYDVASTRIDRFMPSVLAKAFNGELVPQDPSDEPAERMLERLLAQRQRTGIKGLAGKEFSRWPPSRDQGVATVSRKDRRSTNSGRRPADPKGRRG